MSVSPANYKNVKGPDETGKENVYRVTKISGDVTVRVERAAHEHVWSGWISSANVTCTQPGERSRHCTVEGCGVVQNETIEPKGHADRDGDGRCDACGGEICKWCGEVHDGAAGFFLRILHKVFYFFAHAFGLR